MNNTPASTRVTGSRLALLPGTTSPVPGSGANSEPPALLAADTAVQRGGDGYHAWLDHIWPAAGCRHPIRLYGQLTTINTTTGEVTATAHTADMPDAVIYKACGNRRHEICPWCAWTYQGDAYQIIKTGLTGGHGIPAQVSQHPAVFATFTAPSFGPVHSRHFRRHVCRDKNRCSCLPDPCHARRRGTAETCPHGVTIACFARHGRDDAQLGQPFCLDCYDHAHQVVWNQTSGELWRRTKQAIQRRLNHHAKRRGLPPVRVSHGKAAEYQQRGVVHFHALLRLDGIDPDDPAAIVPPPAGLTVVDLEEATRHAMTTIIFTTPHHPTQPGGWPIGWGGPMAQDVRPIALTGNGTVTDVMVGSYLAKYATKGTETTGHTSRRLHDTTIHLYGDPGGNHIERLIQACWDLGHPDHGDHWAGLRRWAHMLGFGGHFLTKARRYSITFANRRHARIIYRRTQTPGPEHNNNIRTADHTAAETTLIIGELTYAGTGWKTTGDALLANTVADQARKRAQAGREELTHQQAQELTPQAA